MCGATQKWRGQKKTRERNRSKEMHESSPHLCTNRPEDSRQQNNQPGDTAALLCGVQERSSAGPLLDIHEDVPGGQIGAGPKGRSLRRVPKEGAQMEGVSKETDALV